MEKKQILAGFGKGTIHFPEALFPVECFQGVHDDPHVRLMVLSCGSEQIAIASVELVNVPSKGIRLCQEIIHRETRVSENRIWVHVTHAISTMHEPGTAGPASGKDQDPGRLYEQKRLFFEALKAAVTDAARSAAADLGPVKIGFSAGECDANVNRDVETPFGWWTGLNPEEPSNKKMSVLRAEDFSGKVKGFLISYGIKPCALDNAGMMDGTRLVSADVCGVCSTMMEEYFGVPALFCVSAAGDQVPKDMATRSGLGWRS